jgi:tetratricopeptide (TPR) repeat protein
MTVRLAPDLAEAHNLRGTILDALGQKEQAIDAYQEALRLQPTFRDAQNNLHEAEAELREQGASSPTKIERTGHPWQGILSLVMGLVAPLWVWVVSPMAQQLSLYLFRERSDRFRLNLAMFLFQLGNYRGILVFAPILGLVLGIAGIRQRYKTRLLAIIGFVLSFLSISGSVFAVLASVLARLI